MNRQKEKNGLLRLVKEHKRTSFLVFLAMALFLIIIFNRHIGLWYKAPVTDLVPFEKSEIFICYSKNTGRLEKKTLEVKKGVPDTERANIIIRELKKEKNIPEKALLYDFATSADETIYLNLSRDIIDEKPDPSREIIMVYSLVNSFLVNFKDSRRIHLLVEGKPVYTINGTVYTYKPLEFNNYIMEE